MLAVCYKAEKTKTKQSKTKPCSLMNTYKYLSMSILQPEKKNSKMK